MAEPSGDGENKTPVIPPPADHRDRSLTDDDPTKDVPPPTDARRRRADDSDATMEVPPPSRARARRGDPDSTLEVPPPVPYGSASPRLRLPRGTTLGRFVVLDVLGEGGMGVVYAAYDPKLDRRVALKLLQSDHVPGTVGSMDARLRLLREAQSMARLAHPNVVSIHDVTAVGEDVVMVMELVVGSTVKQWLKATPRTWREVQEIFVAAGEGLAAAHRAGLIHRDFKPDNILVGSDGRVRVADFGVARAHLPCPAAVHLDRERAGVEASGLDVSGARQGPGTPRYMAPEQFAGEVTSERADQYSFCVTFYEALCGQAPFAGESEEELRKSARDGNLRQPPESLRLPAFLMKVIARGLSPNPADRYPSMEALLRELSQSPAQNRRRLAMVAAMLALAGLTGAVVWQVRPTPAELCASAEDRFTDVWDSAQKQRVQQAFSATGRPISAGAWTLVERSLDDYRQRWLTMHQESCQATRVRGEQSDEVLTLRMACLDRALSEVAALSKMFASADAQLAENVSRSLEGLTPLPFCADVPALLAQVKPPQNPRVRAEVEALRTRLVTARMLLSAGRYEQSAALAEQIAAEGEGLVYPPLMAESLTVLASAQDRLGRFRPAKESAMRGVELALQSGDDRTAAELSRLVAVLHERVRRVDAAEDWLRLTSAMVQRIGGNTDIEARVFNSRGNMALSDGRSEDAIRLYQQALEIAEPGLGPQHSTTLGIRYNLANALDRMGRYGEAVEQVEAVIAESRRALGEAHPFLSYPFTLLGDIHRLQARFDLAREAYEKVLWFGRENDGDDHDINEPLAQIGLAEVALARGDLQTAVALGERASAVVRKMGLSVEDQVLILGRQAHLEWAAGERSKALLHVDEAMKLVRQAPGDVYVGDVLVLQLLARNESSKGRNVAALDLMEKVFTQLAVILPAEHPLVADAHLERGTILNAQRRHEPALVEIGKARSTLERLFGREHPKLSQVLLEEALALTALGRENEALPRLERAAVLSVDTPGVGRADVKLMLAKALARAGQSPERVRGLLEEARVEYARYPAAPARHRETLKTLLAQAPTNTARAPQTQGMGSESEGP